MQILMEVLFSPSSILLAFLVLKLTSVKKNPFFVSYFIFI